MMKPKQRGERTQKQEANRKEAEDALKFVQGVGGSKLDEIRAVAQAGRTRNDDFKDVMSPMADPGVSKSKQVAHEGQYGAPTIYTEKLGGRRNMKGARRG